MNGIFLVIGISLLTIGFYHLFHRKFTFGFFVVGISLAVITGGLLLAKDWEKASYFGLCSLLNGWFFSKSKMKEQSLNKQ